MISGKISSIKIAIFFLLLFIIGCAHIPQESVQLNDMVGKSIADQNRAYINLLNDYFALKRNSIDEFITQTYTPLFMSTLRAKMKKDTVQSIPDTVLVKIISKITSKRDSMQASLEKVRVDIITRTMETSSLILEANTVVTSFLMTASNVNSSAKNILHLADSLSGSKVKLSEFEKTFDQYLIDMGSGAAKANDLYNNSCKIINGGN